MFFFPNCLILYFLGEFSNNLAKLVKFTPEKTQHLSKEKFPKNKQTRLILSLRNLINAKSMLGCSPPTPTSENSLLKNQKKIIKNAIHGKKTILRRKER